jgi:hypothetical protein
MNSLIQLKTRNAYLNRSNLYLKTNHLKNQRHLLRSLLVRDRSIFFLLENLFKGIYRLF